MPLREVQIMNRPRVVPEGTTKRYREENFHTSYATLNELGRGRFAVVRKCKHKETNRHFAAKFVRKRKMGRDCREDILKEIRILENSTLNPRLIALHEVYETSTEVILVLEYASGGELHQYCVADKEDGFCERDVVRLLHQIIEGVLYLHTQNIAHLDLKPQNILLTTKEPSTGDIKLIDFGIARYLNKGEEIRDIQGTPDYVAPEILNYEPITLATDMWSIGVLAYVMLTGISPFAGDTKQETFLNISQVTLEFPEEDFGCYSTEARDFIQSLCLKEPERRLTAQECLDHPWVQKFVSNAQTVQELDDNENIHQDKNSNSSQMSSLTVDLLIHEENIKRVKSNQEDDENKNYIDNRVAVCETIKELKRGGEQAEDALVPLLTETASGGLFKEEAMSDIDIHMECDSKDGLEEPTPDLTKNHSHVTENHSHVTKDHSHMTKDHSQMTKDHSHAARVPHHSKSEYAVDCALEKRDRQAVSQLLQVTGEGGGGESLLTSSQSDGALLVEKKCRCCHRLHPDQQSVSEKSRSPSSSPLGTRRAICPNKENLPKNIREPKRFCHQVPGQQPGQQPGQVVC